MRLVNTLLAIGAVLTVTAITTAIAFADGRPVGPRNILRLEQGGTVTPITWGGGSDSRFDQNAKRLHAHVEAGSYFAAYSDASLAINKPLLNVQNLSFEYSQAGHIGAGAPRISVVLDDGTVLYLAAFYCNHTVGQTNGKGPSWGRADFTRYLTDCAIWDSGGTEYSADGSRTALEVYDATHPDAIVKQSVLVDDEGGNVNLDRIALGTARMYVRGFRSAVRCPSEGAC